MQQHFCVAIDPPIELVVCFDSVVNADLVADHEAWLCLTRDDQVAEVPVVRLDVALSSAERQTLSRLLESVKDGL